MTNMDISELEKQTQDLAVKSAFKTSSKTVDEDGKYPVLLIVMELWVLD
jgi:hypothetical protein